MESDRKENETEESRIFQTIKEVAKLMNEEVYAIVKSSDDSIRLLTITSKSQWEEEQEEEAVPSCNITEAKQQRDNLDKSYFG